MSEGLGWHWVALWDCRPTWLATHMGQALDVFSTTRVWAELALPGGRGLGGAKRALRVGTTSTLASRDGIDAQLELSPMNDAFSLSLRLQGDALARLGASVATEIAEAIVELTLRWRAEAALVMAVGVPVTVTAQPFVYARPRPPVETVPGRSLHALVDVIDTRSRDADSDEAIADRTLAESSLPATATRTERDGVVTIVFASSVASRREAAIASAAHHAWVTEVLPTVRAPGWNALGDQRVTGEHHATRPPFKRVLRTPLPGGGQKLAGVVYLDGALTADVAAAAYQRTGIDEVYLAVESRDRVAMCVEQARHAGFDKVIYRDAQAGLWDPEPDGAWLDAPPPVG